MLDAGLAADPRAVRRAGRVPARGRRWRRSRRPAARPGPEHVDRTDRPFVTLDPAELDRPRPGLRHRARRRRHRAALRHRRRRVLRPARRRRSTTRRGSAASPCTCPTSGPACTRPRCRRAPPACCPTGPARPWCSPCASTADGDVAARRRRAGGRAQPGQAGLRHRREPTTCRPSFAELARRIAAAEERRGAPRVEFPEQELERVDGHWAAALRSSPARARTTTPRMSLATNLAVADALPRRRHRAVPGDGRARRARAVERLRHTARAFGLDWPAAQSLADFQRSLPTTDPRAAAFLIAVRRAGGGARYEPYTPGRDAVARGDGRDVRPRHRPAAPPRRPLRRRGGAGRRQRATRARRRAGGVRRAARRRWPGASAGQPRRRAVIDLAEAVLLAGRVGEVFDAVVVDEDRRGAVVQLVDPAVLVARRRPPGRSRRRRACAHHRRRRERPPASTSSASADGTGHAASRRRTGPCWERA